MFSKWSKRMGSQVLGRACVDLTNRPRGPIGPIANTWAYVCWYQRRSQVSLAGGADRIPGGGG